MITRENELANIILQPNFVARSYKNAIFSYIAFYKEKIEDLYFNQHKTLKLIFNEFQKKDNVFLKIPYQFFFNWCKKNIKTNNVAIVSFDTSDKIYNEAISVMLANKKFLNAKGFLKTKYLDFVFMPFKHKISECLKRNILENIIFEIIKQDSEIISKYCSLTQFFQYCKELRTEL